MFVDIGNGEEVTTEEFDAYINSKKTETGDDYYTQEQKNTMKEHFAAMDTDNNGKVTTTEEIKYLFQTNVQDSISKQDLKTLYGEETANEMMKFDTNNDGKLDKEEFNKATEGKKVNDEKKVTDEKEGLSAGKIIAIVSLAVTIIGLLIGIVVWLSRRKKKNKSEVGQELNVRNGNIARHQPEMNNIYDGYNEAHSNNSRSQIGLDSINKYRENSIS